MKNTMSLALLAVLSLAAPALAETRFSIGAESRDMTVTLFGMDASETVPGVYLAYESDNDNGFETRSRVFYSNKNDIDYLESNVELSWKWRDIVGPKVAYTGAAIDGDGEEVYLAGLTAARRIGTVELRTDLLSDVENFGDQAYIALGAEWDVTEKFTLGAEVAQLTSTDISSARLTASYHLTENIFVEMDYARSQPSGEIDYSIASVGLGWRF